MSDETFFGRWSRRKIAARRGDPLPAQPAAPATAEAPLAAREAPGARLEPETPVPAAAPQAAPLPSLESLTPESDFVPFMRGDVDTATRGQALKTLFKDPRYNVMDGLDVYIDDYSKSEPLPPGIMEKLEQAQKILEWAREKAESAAQTTAEASAAAGPATEQATPRDEDHPHAGAPTDTEKPGS